MPLSERGAMQVALFTPYLHRNNKRRVLFLLDLCVLFPFLRLLSVTSKHTLESGDPKNCTKIRFCFCAGMNDSFC